jgi:hypothetical protein
LKELEPLFQNNLESYLVVINRLRKHEASLWNGWLKYGIWENAK